MIIRRINEIVTIAPISPIIRGENCNNWDINDKNMDGFKAIRLRIRTIERYKGFSKKMTKSYSETLEVIMDFRAYLRYYISDHRPLWMQLDL